LEAVLRGPLRSSAGGLSALEIAIGHVPREFSGNGGTVRTLGVDLLALRAANVSTSLPFLWVSAPVQRGVPIDAGPAVHQAMGIQALSCGPTAPRGAPASNKTRTFSGAGWFASFRMSGPTHASFERLEVLQDIVLVPRTHLQ
jgi:hypothetical protein